MYKIKGLEKYRRPIPKLNDGQFKAIHDSLAKWQFLSWHPEGNYGNAPECLCCDAFHTYKDDYMCTKCPIALITKFPECELTPFYIWSYNCDYNEPAHQEAEDEYHFLEGIYSIELHRRMNNGKS